MAADPQAGRPLLEKWVESRDPDVLWVVRENLGKARLARGGPPLGGGDEGAAGVPPRLTNTPPVARGPGMKGTMSETEAVIGLETHIQLNTQHQDLLRLQGRFVGRRSEHQHLPGVHRAARRAARAQPGGDRQGRAAWRRHARRRDPARSPTSPARTTSTPTCPRATRSRSTTSRWRVAATSTCPCRTANVRRVTSIKLHLEEDAGKTVHAGRAEADRLQPLRRAAGRDGHRPRPALGRRGGPVPHPPAAAAALAGRLGRRHGARPPAL